MTASRNISDLVAEVFLPMERVTRCDRRNTRRKISVDRPLFQPYLFVSFDPQVHHWLKINGNEGVDHVLCTSAENPIRIPKREMDKLRRYVDREGGIVGARKKDEPRFEQGAQLRVISGPFMSFNGICKASDAEQVKLLLDIFKRDVPVTLDCDQVEVAA